MAGEKVTRILKSKSNFTDEQISSMSDAEGWSWIYANKKPNPDKDKNQICFTGFSPAEKESLTLSAEEAGLKVVKSVTKSLNFLCTGDNAGPKKIEKARQQDVIILSVPQFSIMLETGELPEN